MSTYISSNSNRFYVAKEASFATPAAISSSNRFPANKLEIHRTTERLRRPYKTGSRTYIGQDGIGRQDTAFVAKSYLTAWDGNSQPHYGPLFEAATGGNSTVTTDHQVANSTSALVQTVAPHQLRNGSAICRNGELRFVKNTIDVTTVQLNAPFTRPLTSGDHLTPVACYTLGSQLPSVSIYDYWDPTSAVSRLAIGAAVNRLRIGVNGDYHEFLFSGPAADVLDSRTFETGDAGLWAFPAEPARAPFSAMGVPGHLGHAWIGESENECLTLTSARVEIDNNIQVRNREFGALIPRAIAPGERTVSIEFTLLARDDQQTLNLYSAAKQGVGLPVMLQLGIQRGRLLGIYMPCVVPELPEFDDTDSRLRWTFTNNLAKGIDNDELFLALG